MKRKVFLAAVIGLIAPALVLAQTPISDPVAGLLLPDGSGVWVVKVFTSGGFTGTGTGNVGITSNGSVVCSGRPSCPKKFEFPAFQRMIDRLPGDLSAQSKFLSPPVSCNDCLTREVAISKRDAMGIEHVYSFFWSDVTAGSVPNEIMQIYDAVRLLK